MFIEGHAWKGFFIMLIVIGENIMEIETKRSNIKDVIVIVPETFRDSRGYFSEMYRADQFKAAGLPSSFVQVNQSGSIKNTLRGLHFQWSPPMGKLMRVNKGQAFLVAVDIRRGSPTFGRWYGAEITGGSRIQIWAPAGFARGFCVLSEYAEIQYMCTSTYNGSAESGILWNDQDIGIDWPIKEPLLSRKDANAQRLSDWLKKEESYYFQYRGGKAK